MRYPSVDILRSVAIVVMVLVHFAENLAGASLLFAGLGAPMFSILTGISYRLWLNGQLRRKISDDEISKISMRRGLFVFGVGFAFNIFVWLPEDTFNWDVLTFIGIALLFLNQMRLVPVSISVVVAIAIWLMTPVLQALVGYSEYWVNGYFEIDLTLPDVFIGFFVTGYFPLFPWLTYSLAGYVAATLLFPPYASPQKTSATPLILFSAMLLALASLTLQIRSYLPEFVTTNLLKGWSMFPASLEYVAATIGMALLFFALLHKWVDQHPNLNTDAPAFRLFKVFSRYAFTIYLLHHMVHLWPLWIYGYRAGGETTAFWRNALSFTTSMWLAVLFLTICYAILSRIDPDKRYGVEGWMRWLCG